jgi:hypothetical protein
VTATKSGEVGKTWCLIECLDYPDLVAVTFSEVCRVSTIRQKADSQVSEIKKWLAAHGHDGQQVAWYIDHQTGNWLPKGYGWARLPKPWEPA